MRFGLWCKQHGVWFKSDDGTILNYPDKELAQAHLRELVREQLPGWTISVRRHSWEVTQIGQEDYVRMDKLPAGTELCGGNLRTYPYV